MTKLSTFITATVAMITAVVFTSCDEKEYNPTAPEWGELLLSETTCNPGDSIFATVKVKTEGEYYYYYRLHYSINGVASVIEKDGLHSRKGDISFGFKAPSKAGVFTVSSHASVSFTANGQLYGTTNTVSKILTVIEPNNEPTE